MKKFFYTLFAIMAIVACSESDVDNGGNSGGGQEPPKQPEITLSTTAADFSTDGGSDVITFTSSEAWTAQVVNTRADDWCSIEPTSGPAGSAKITVTTTPNDTPDDRTASIIIKAGTTSKTINVSQKQKDALTVTSSKFEVSAEGGEVSIEIKANIDFEYTIEESAADWVEYKATRALKTSNLVFEIKENDDTDKREAKITITNGEFSEVVTIYQAGFEPSIILSKNEIYISYEKNTISVDVKSNIDVDITIPSDVEWIKENTTRAYSTNTYYFDVEQNDGYSARVAEIEFANKVNDVCEKLTITQTPDEARALAAEREALIAFYKATGGDNWTRNDNWCSDKPVSEWYGIYTNDNGTINRIRLSDNNLEGTIPANFIELYELEYLDLGWNKLTGSIPTELGKLSNLSYIILGWNKLSGAIPIELAQLTNLIELYLGGNQLSGSIPAELCQLSKLKSLDLGSNRLSGDIPTELSQLSELEILSFNNNQLSGSIPTELGQLSNLTGLWLSVNTLSGSIPAELGQLSKLKTLELNANQLSGSIPSDLGQLTELEVFALGYNYLTGIVPQSIMELDCWDDCWPNILKQQGEGLSSEGVKIYAPEFSIPTIGGGVITDEFISQHKYTVLYNFFEWCPYSEVFTPILKSVVDKYKDSGLGIFSTTSDEESLVKACIDRNGIDWPCTVMQDLSASPFKPFLSESPMVAVFDQDGLIVFNGILTSYTEMPAFLSELFGDSEEELYESTDYSKDGEVKQLQKATKGKGIDIVLMGDAFSDRLITDGSYDKAMNAGMEGFFASEPYKSFRDYFNVYSVTAVSKNEVYTDDSETAFAGYFGDNTLVGGNDTKAMSYARKAINDDRMDNALVVVMMNSPRFAGTCYMYYPETTSEDYGCGISVSYFPVGYSDLQINNLIRHEAGGHGFAKLADEYAYSWLGKMPDEEIEYHKEQMPWGWWKNADFTSDPAKVKWSHFLSDSRYANEGLGVYEGAFTYYTGAYRPTEDSAMNSGNIGFNAPSREAIYYRIHKLAYGADWEYDYEEFVKWDERNRNKEQTRGVPYRLDIPDNFQPTHPPVVINKSWRDAK